MRKYSIVLLLIVAMALLLGVTACGGSSQSGGGSQAASNSGNQTPQGILTKAFSAGENLKSGTGSFDVTVTMDADASKVSADMKAFVGSPIKVTGTFSEAQNPEVADMTMSLQLAGQTLDVGLKSVGGKSWVQFGGQWYEVSADMLGAATTGSTTPTSEPSIAEITKLLSDLGIDPTTWITNLTLVGEEQVDGAAALHIKGNPDVAKMMTDLMQLMKSPEFTKLMGSSASTGTSGMMSLSSLIPSPDQLQQMQNEITQMFKDVTVEAWVDKAESFVRKATITANITPPAGQATDGVNGIKIDATINMKDFNQAVSVQAPASSQPITELEKAIQSNPQLLGPLGTILGGLMSGAGSTSDTVTTSLDGSSQSTDTTTAQ